MKKIIVINLLLFFILIVILFVILYLLNLYVGGPPRYYELLYSNKRISINEHKEKLIFYKKNINKKINKSDFFKVNSLDYNKFSYSGKIKFVECGKIESGYRNLVYKTDKYGFRENNDNLYKETDFVLLGDSFGISDCVNKPNDLVSNLQLLNDNYNFLNLSERGTDYPDQILNLKKFTRNTSFDYLIWFFYEGNDYETKFNKKNHLGFKTKHNKILQNDHKFEYEVNNHFNISTVYKLKVYLSELVGGFSTIIKFFRKYDDLLDEKNYETAMSEINKYLDDKNIKKRYIYYIPSWQRLSNYKQKKLNLYLKNPQIIQLNELKENVKRIAEKYNFNFIDGEKTFLKNNNPLQVFHYNLNTHFNELGYSVLAKDLYSNIKELELKK